MSTMYVMVGLPGCGKSTYANKIKDAVVISTDEIREELFGSASVQSQGNKVFTIAYQRIEDALAHGHDVAFDATNLKRRDRRRVMMIAKNYQCNTKAIVFDLSVEECMIRQQQRERQVPREVIERMSQGMTMPTVEEGFDDVVIIE